MGFQKPHSIQYRNLMDIRSQDFLRDDFTSEIYYCVKLQRFWERVAEFSLAKDQHIAAPAPTLSPEIAMQTFLEELGEIRETMPEATRNTGMSSIFMPRNSAKMLPVTIGILDRFAQVAIYSYSLGFFRRPYRVVVETHTRPENASHDYKCLEACKAFFEYLLSLPEENFLAFTTLHWTVVVHSTLVLTRLTFAMASDLGWDPKTTRANIPMVMYLDCLCWRLQSLSSNSDEAEKSPQSFDPLYIFRVVLESLKNSYLRRVAEIKSPSIPANLSSREKGQCPIRDPELNAYFESALSQSSGSYDDSASGTSSNVPIYFDICKSFFLHLYLLFWGVVLHQVLRPSSTVTCIGFIEQGLLKLINREYHDRILGRAIIFSASLISSFAFCVIHEL